MSDQPRSWQIVDGCLLQSRLLVVSFQRYLLPEMATLQRAPPSSGILPIAEVEEGVLLPVAPLQGVWIGLAPATKESGAVSITFETSIGRLTLPETRVDHDVAVEGIPRPEGDFWPIARVNAHGIECLALVVTDAESSQAVRVLLTGYEHFVSSSGRSAPRAIDEVSTYGGWLLP